MANAKSPKYAPPLEFDDDAALSPPDGYKDNGLKEALDGTLTSGHGHIFGAQHLQQLQVIQRLQQQRAAMLAAARQNSQGGGMSSPPPPLQPSATGGMLLATVASNSMNNGNHSTNGNNVGGNCAIIGSGSGGGTAIGGILTQHPSEEEILADGICTECAECAECVAKQLQQETGKRTHYLFLYMSLSSSP